MRRLCSLAILVTCGAFATQVFAGSPSEQWVDSWTGPAGHDDLGLLVVADAAGRSYVAGSTYEIGIGGNREDWFLNQYDGQGQLQWTRFHGGEGFDEPSAMLITHAAPNPGTIAVTGATWDTVDTVHQVSTLVYDDTGAVIWEQHFPLTGIPTIFTKPQMREDLAGNLLVTGQSGSDYLIVKYSPEGALLWDRVYDGPGNDLDTPTGLTVDSAGNVFVTGVTQNTPGGGMAYATVKYDATGGFQWEQFESGDIGSVFGYAGIDIGPDGDPIVVGTPESAQVFVRWRVALASRVRRTRYLQRYRGRPRVGHRGQRLCRRVHDVPSAEP